MPTVADIVGVKKPFQTDGISFLPTLLNQKNQKKHDYLYWEFNHKGGRKAVRMGKWKGVLYQAIKNPNAKIELYNLEIDPSESNNIAKQYPEIVKKIDGFMSTSHVNSSLFPFK